MINEGLMKIIQEIPKAENHLHFEGALEPETLLMLAERNKIELPFKTVEEVRELYAFKNLNEFLDAFATACSTLCKPEDFTTMTIELAKDAKRQNIVYRDVMFTYAYHERRGISLETVVEGLAEGRKRAWEDYGVDMRFIADIDRTIDPSESLAYVESIAKVMDKTGIVAIGLDSQEHDYPASLHAEAFKKAKEYGLKLTAHAGEDDGPESVWDTIKSLNVDRIDHGVRAMEDEKLMEYLIENQIPLTISPVSNVALKVYPNMVSHPIKELLDRGVVASVSSDDPPFFFADLIDNYVAITEAFDLDESDIIKIARNGILGSYMDDDKKEKYLKEIDEWV
jgi:adenosine deaminase